MNTSVLGHRMKLVDSIIDGILEREGWPAYTNDPADRGGPTKGGITLKAWRDYISYHLPLRQTAEDLQRVTFDQARQFYRHKYIVEPNFGLIDDPYLQELVIDSGVHHGTRHAAKWLQHAANVKQDGHLGNISLSAIAAANPRELYLWMIAYRVRLFGRLVGRDPELKRAQAAGFNLQARWAGGWNNRAAAFIEYLAERLETEHQLKQPRRAEL